MSQHSVLFYKSIDEYYSNKNKKKPWTSAELNEVSEFVLIQTYPVVVTQIGMFYGVSRKRKEIEKNNSVVMTYFF